LLLCLAFDELDFDKIIQLAMEDARRERTSLGNKNNFSSKS
jgi:hypothetical protein